MKIGIFGCSYADENSCRFTQINTGKAWSALLKNQTDLEIENYAQSGSSVYYSYNLFQKHHKKFDKIIYVVTSPTRITINHPTKPGEKLFFTSWETIVEKQKQSMKDLGILDAIDLYYQYIYDLEEFTTYRNLIIQDLQSRPNCLVLDFDDLLKVSIIDWGFFKRFDNQTYNDNTLFIDNRYCHMSTENNIILSDMVLSWIRTGTFNYDFSKFVNPRLIDRFVYFVKR